MQFSSFAKSLTLAITVLLSAQAFAIEPIFSSKDGAIRGYDPVAYFTKHKAVKGSKKLSTTWQGAEWHFSSQTNLDAFVADPEKYAPQYGGYCAFGVAQGFTPEIDPQAFAVRDGKLYLNLSKDVLKRWKENIPGYIADANKNWPELKAGTYVEK
ncbi:YHS domain-containing (seleno)protein [Undibacterium sp. Di24W]|uniref:YHS domain-containing (seleno)protein n=1 Tax=Undibacterium sp. Di24W TaxID=3413033 RepID=UPI003BEFEADF